MQLELRSVVPAENRYRWYAVRLQPCLFGGVDVIRWWGRLGQGPTGSKMVHCQNQAEAEDHVERVARLRKRHGYRRARVEV